MRTPFLLLAICLFLSIGASVANLPDLGLIFLCGGVAALVLGLRAAWRARRTKPRAQPRPTPQSTGRPLLVDGSNVIHWKDNFAQIDPLSRVVKRAIAAGYAPLVVFDANIGYKLKGQFLSEEMLAAMLRLDPRQVQIVPSGQPADPEILRHATALKARIVTNDRYRDWLDAFPHAKNRNILIRGHYRGEKLQIKF